MFLNSYIIGENQPVKLRFLPLGDRKIDENHPIITLDIILKDDKVYVLIGKPDNTPLALYQHSKDICAKLFKLLKIRFNWVKETKDFQWYFLASEGNKFRLFKMELNLEEKSPYSLYLIPINDSPFNLMELKPFKS